MAQKEPDILDRFADGLANFAARMKAIERTPEFQQKRQAANTQALFIGLIGLPVGILAVLICEHFGWPRQLYFPIVALISIGGSRLLGIIFANRL